MLVLDWAAWHRLSCNERMRIFVSVFGTGRMLDMVCAYLYLDEFEQVLDSIESDLEKESQLSFTHLEGRNVQP